MKFTLSALALVGTFGVNASAACPPVVAKPTSVQCTLQGSYVGAKISKVVTVQLKETAFQQWEGSTEFSVNSVSGAKPNSIQLSVFNETHGNSTTCEVQQSVEGTLTLLDFQIPASRKVSLSLEDGFTSPSLKVNMNCRIR